MEGCDLALEGAVIRGSAGRSRGVKTVLIRDGWIDAVTRARDAMNIQAGARVNIEGALLLPGFVDAHLHFLEGSIHALGPRLHDVSSAVMLARRLEEVVRRTPPGQWILGSGWNENLWPGASLPHRSWIDPVSPDHPVFLQRHDLHLGIANERALRLAGIRGGTPDPPGGRIDRDAGGKPTGILRDNAMNALFRVVPPRDDATRREALASGFRHALAAGLTGFHEFDDLNVLPVYAQLDARGELPLRVLFHPFLNQRAQIERPRYSDRLAVGALKAFLDGSLGSRTARFFDPYTDAPGEQGVWVWADGPRGRFREEAVAADAAGHQLALHAIGDEAVAEALDLAEALNAANGPRDRRFRIEHAQHLRPGDFERMGRLGVVASVQPAHLADDGVWAATRIGNERCKTTYAFRSMTRAGARLAFGSDWPVAPLEPLAGIRAAVTRALNDGSGKFAASESIALSTAIDAYTRGPAWAGYDEALTGEIAPRKRADLVAIEPDPYTLPPEELDRVRIRLTVVDGRVAYDASG